MEQTIRTMLAKPKIEEIKYGSKLEAAWAEELRRLEEAEEILRYYHEPMNLRLAANTYYRPDFMVIYAVHVEFHEVKGFWRDDARVKIKVAAEKFPEFVFKVITKKKNQWHEETV